MNMILKKGLTAVLMMLAGSLQAAEYHVAKNGKDGGDGSAGKPFLTIQRAADAAQPGDVITVHAGTYRERINPPRGGVSDDRRIVYRAAPGESVVIKGSEKVTGWQPVEDDTWSVTLPNSFFGDYNPYSDRLEGAWYEAKQAFHTGAVYLNGHWLKETAGKEFVVKSLASRNADNGAAELMNIQSFTLGTAGGLPAAEFIDSSDGVQGVTDDPEKMYVGRMTDGSYVAYHMDFGEESKFMSLLAASPVAGGIIELRKDRLDGELLGSVDVGFTAEWTHFQRFHANITPISGVQKIYCVFKARPEPPVDPANDIGSWFAEVDERNTTIWADFKGKDPNRERVEINVRKAVFYPEQEGCNYITVRGFTMEHSANPWTAPTAEQVGLIGTHWSKGWIIEDNTIRYSVCVGVTLGKHGDEHDHTYDYNHTSIPEAVKRGWSRENIGSHMVRNNHIYHCGQGGIQGSLGCSFSTIEGNEIHDIRKDHSYGGCETAGIKLHGAVDVLIRGNHVYNCEHWGGIWLDWMAQGARVTGNLLHGNSQDLMFEVNHGPYLVDNNLLLSRAHVTEASGGGAFVHNLWYGSINIWPDLKVRKTPYFKPHSTEIIDRIDIDQNDDRFCNNIFIGPKGTAAYNEPGFCPAAEGNVFLAGAEPSIQEVNALEPVDFDPAVKLEKRTDGWWLEMTVDPAWKQQVTRPLVTSALLGKAAIPGARFEERDGNPYRIDTDYFGNKRSSSNPAPGPFRSNGGEDIRVKVWPVEAGALTGRREAPLSNAFYAFDNGVGQGRWSPQVQAETLKALGYAGIGYSGVGGITERFEAFEAQGLRIYSLYVQCAPGKEPPYSSQLLEAMQELAGTGIIPWLTVAGKTTDEDAARVVREIADAAKPYGVKIALYPHYGFHVATATDAVRLLKIIDRPNVGIGINLCHELKAGNRANLCGIVKEAAPYLYLVSINGAERDGRGWDELIQPLGEGDFNVSAFLAQLSAVGYSGPIGLQCFGVQGDHRENLKKSMETWKNISCVSSHRKE